MQKLFQSLREVQSSPVNSQQSLWKLEPGEVAFKPAFFFLTLSVLQTTILVFILRLHSFILHKEQMKCPKANKQHEILKYDIKLKIDSQIEQHFCSVTHLLWGRVRWHGARWGDRGFSRRKAEALSCVWRRGERTGSGAWLQTFGAGPAQLGLRGGGEHGLARWLGWGGGWCGASWGCGVIKRFTVDTTAYLLFLSMSNPYCLLSDTVWADVEAYCSWQGWGVTF